MLDSKNEIRRLRIIVDINNVNETFKVTLERNGKIKDKYDMNVTERNYVGKYLQALNKIW